MIESFRGPLGAVIVAGIVAVASFLVGGWMAARPAYWDAVARGQRPSSVESASRTGPVLWRVWGALVIACGLVFAGYAVWSAILLVGG